MVESERFPAKETLPYRERAVLIVYDHYERVLVSQPKSYQTDRWNFPGGGIEEGESVEEAALREFREETNGENISILTAAKTTSSYEWPEVVTENVFTNTGKLFRGQKQNFVLAYYDGNPETLEPNPEELRRFDWVATPKLKELFKFPEQWEKTEPVIKELWDDHIRTGTEFYGLRYGAIETRVQTALQRQKHLVFDPARLLRMMSTYEGQPFPDGLLEMPLPRVFDTLADLKKRFPLIVFDESVVRETTKETLADVLAGFDHYININRPGQEVITEIKLYEEYLSGDEPSTVYLSVPAADVYSSIGNEARVLEAKSGKNWTGGFSGRVWISPEDKKEIKITSLKEIEEPLEIHGATALFVPLFDFDTQFSANPSEEKENITEILRTNGFSGWIANSGRGHHYIADFLLPYSEFHKTLGLLAKLSISHNPEFDKNRDFAERIYNAKSLEEARLVADAILDPVDGIPNTDTPAVGDIRWVAHCLKRGSPILRAIPYWKNPVYPTVVARIY